MQNYLVKYCSIKFCFLIIIYLFLLFTPINLNAAVNGRFVTVQQDSNKYAVKFQINSDSNKDTIGCSTIIFNFNNQVLSFPSTPVKNTDYSFIDLSASDYNLTLTRPLENQIWINIETLASIKGTALKAAPGWTDVVQINFYIANKDSAINLTWQTLNTNYAIYGITNTATLSLGTWEDETTAPLPVELTNFSAAIEKNNNVILNWQTASEINNFGFEIERSPSQPSHIVAGQREGAETVKWYKIGFIKGNGTINSVINYSFTDVTAINGNKYKYRLKQVDFDGSYNFSNEIEADLSPKEFKLFQNYPNPFNPTTSIQYSVSSNQFVRLKVYDIAGREVATLVNENKQPGIYEAKFDASSLSSGVYIYRLITTDYTDIKKMILLK